MGASDPCGRKGRGGSSSGGRPLPLQVSRGRLEGPSAWKPSLRRVSRTVWRLQRVGIDGGPGKAEEFWMLRTLERRGAMLSFRAEPCTDKKFLELNKTATTEAKEREDKYQKIGDHVYF